MMLPKLYRVRRLKIEISLFNGTFGIYNFVGLNFESRWYNWRKARERKNLTLDR